MGKAIQADVQKRNYQLDFLKLFFAILVFWWHTHEFVGENTRITFPVELARASVHFFFIVSGMLMANSIVKRGDNILNPGKSAISFVIKKYKSIAWQHIVALILYLIIYLLIYNVYKTGADPATGPLRALTRIFPELFLVNSSGVWIFFNEPVWYLSAMLICMLPLAYLLYKNRSFALYVFAPLATLFTYGYMYKSNNYYFIDQDKLCGEFIMGSIIRAMCGLCFGICAWTIYNKIKNTSINKNTRILITVTEIVLYLIFFATWFFLNSAGSLKSVLLILPIALAITFSEKSYVSRLFRFKWMRYFGPLSLAIYLNQWPGYKIVKECYPNYSYKFSALVMALITALFCLLNFLIVKLGKSLWNKKLKDMFTKPDNV